MDDHTELKKRLREKYLQKTVLADVDEERQQALRAIENLERSANTANKTIKRLERENETLRNKLAKQLKPKKA